MNKNSHIYVAGHTGLVGSAILRLLRIKGYDNIITRNHKELDLLDQQAVAKFFASEKPEYVFLAAARVGGIMANDVYRAQFIYENLQIQNNVIHQSYLHGVKKLLYLGSSCIYPRNAPQPMKEEYLLTSELEYTNEPYAIAKIAGMKMCEAYNLQYGTNFIPVMPTNLYGPNDNYDLETSHAFPALLRKFHLGKCLGNNDWDALRKDLNKSPVEQVNGSASEKEILSVLSKYGIEKGEQVSVTLWGSGKPKREFLHVDDLAEACLFLMNKINFKDLIRLSTNKSISVPCAPCPEPIKNTHVNIGTGEDLSIKELAETMKNIIGFRGEVIWDSSKPDGTPRKLLDISRIENLGWKFRIDLEEGIRITYSYYQGKKIL